MTSTFKMDKFVKLTLGAFSNALFELDNTDAFQHFHDNYDTVKDDVLEVSLAYNFYKVREGTENFYKIFVGDTRVGYNFKTSNFKDDFNFLVFPAFRKQGFGTDVVKYMANNEFVHGKRFHFIRATPESLEFYKKLGYVEVNFPNGAKLPDAIVVKYIHEFQRDGRLVKFVKAPIGECRHPSLKREMLIRDLKRMLMSEISSAA